MIKFVISNNEYFINGECIDKDNFYEILEDCDNGGIDYKITTIDNVNEEDYDCANKCECCGCICEIEDESEDSELDEECDCPECQKKAYLVSLAEDINSMDLDDIVETLHEEIDEFMSESYDIGFAEGLKQGYEQALLGIANACLDTAETLQDDCEEE
jgi:flagellar biosynthesis/type III secretory pathway protein FliH